MRNDDVLHCIYEKESKIEMDSLEGSCHFCGGVSVVGGGAWGSVIMGGRVVGVVGE